ncbi:MAG TPA: efflux RND transporter periplasmic adaptor subunit [Candidatus Acidoferrales bacterium]|jgi:RND family efflux transporter MFP subunit|nr:efflux RND transporter periplasmic adaptor subunit [Candidatus Acidoferrales bacterium]
MSKKSKLVIVGLVFFGLIALWLGWRHEKTEADDAEPAGKAHGEVVAAVVKVSRGKLGAPLTLAGAFKPFQDVDVHAKVAGYIKKIYVDVGSRVTEGQTLAVLEVPELAAQLAGADAAVRRSRQEISRAQGDVERAKSAHAAVHAMCQRLQQASEQKAGLVAQQEVDNARAKDLEGEAQVSSAEAALSGAQQASEVAEANAKQYAALSQYTRIVAPFTGVVTVRYADTGSLIAAGTASSTQSTPVVRIAQISVLRLVLPIPESIAGEIRLNDPVKVHVQALNADYVGKVSRFADSLDSQTRTMEAEIDFQNADGRLLPGMYVQAIVAPPDNRDMLTVPLEAVELGADASEGSALVVSAKNILEERKVQLGLQGSTRVEVRGGLTDGERVVVGSRNAFRAGMKIVTKEIDPSRPGETEAK